MKIKLEIPIRLLMISPWVANCLKNSLGCHYLQIVKSYKPRTIIVKVKVDNETLYSEIDF